MRNLLSINSRSEQTVNTNIDHNKYIRNNFWGYVKNFLTRKSTVLPTFNKDDCVSSPRKRFAIPSWIPSLSFPHVPFNIDPPSYQQITNIIRNMKASASPCPLDQVSIISFKRCPYLRSHLTDLIRRAWFSGVVPSAWKRACTVLVHKKEATDDPSNFRLITLESVPLNIFTSCLRNSIFKFLTENNFIETAIQKGFYPKISGTLEHTGQMGHVINQARVKQRSLLVTLLDLKNVFGEVHHHLIQEVLSYHHIPEHIKCLIRNLYTDLKTSIITHDFSTPFITIGRGLLQGDCLSLLLFNRYFNTSIQHIKSD